jgi:metal-sulfur cluster biosynthetic enzyme
MAMPTEDEIREALKIVEDPEIGLSIIDLGLVYGAEVKDHAITVTMTLTTPFCPAGPLITSQVESVLSSLPEVERVDVDITFNPPWDPRTMASDEVKAMLGLW